MTVQIEYLLASLNEELRLAKERRSAGASDLSLQSVVSLLQRADTLAASGQWANAKELFDAAAGQVSDSWSSSSRLGVEVLEVVRWSSVELQTRAAEDESVLMIARKLGLPQVGVIVHDRIPLRTTEPVS